MNHRLFPVEEFPGDLDGYLLVGGEINEENVKKSKATGRPVVLVDQYLAGVKVDCIVSDGYDGAVYGIKLLSGGLKRIVNIHGPLSHFGFRTVTTDTWRPWNRRLSAEILRVRRGQRQHGSDHRSDAFEIRTPDAVFGCNDAIRAIGVEGT